MDYVAGRIYVILYILSSVVAVTLTIVDTNTRSNQTYIQFNGQSFSEENALIIEVDPGANGYNSSILLLQALDTAFSMNITSLPPATNQLHQEVHFFPQCPQGQYVVTLKDTQTGEELATTPNITVLNSNTNSTATQLMTTLPTPSTDPIIPSPTSNNALPTTSISTPVGPNPSSDTNFVGKKRVIVVALSGSIGGTLTLLIIIGIAIHFRPINRRLHTLDPVKARRFWKKKTGGSTLVTAQPYQVFSPLLGAVYQKSSRLPSSTLPLMTVQHDRVNALTEVIARLQDRMRYFEETHGRVSGPSGDVNDVSTRGSGKTDDPPPQYPETIASI